VRKIAKKYGVTAQEIYGRSREKTIQAARVAVYQKMRDIGMSYPEIGRVMERNHTTILMGLREKK